MANNRIKIVYAIYERNNITRSLITILERNDTLLDYINKKCSSLEKEGFKLVSCYMTNYDIVRHKERLAFDSVVLKKNERKTNRHHK